MGSEGRSEKGVGLVSEAVRKVGNMNKTNAKALILRNLRKLMIRRGLSCLIMLDVDGKRSLLIPRLLPVARLIEIL